MLITANGVNFHVEQHGSTGAPALVFLHYWGGTGRTWKPLISCLPAGFRSITMDARGWGRSACPDTGHDIASMADDVEQTIMALGLDRYVLVGHSMGGKVAQLLASRQPSGCMGLALIAPSPAQGKNLPEPQRQQMCDAYASAESVAWTLDHVLSAGPLLASLREQVIVDSLGGSPAAKTHWPMHAIAENVAADLDRIRVPVRIIGGEKDQVDDVEMLQQVVVPSLPDADLQVVPGAGHLLPLEAPERLAAWLAEFIGGL